MATPVTTCRHHLPVGPLQDRLSERVARRQAALPHTMAGGHQAGASVGTEHALCQSSGRGLEIRRCSPYPGPIGFFVNGLRDRMPQAASLVYPYPFQAGPMPETA